MSKKPIDAWSLRYKVVKTYASFCHRLFYRKITFRFRERIPRNQPVILAPNHQNALMDAMALVFSSWRDPVFVARADVFSNRILAGIWRLFKIYPIYRIRDGVGELAKNEEIFRNAIKVLDRSKSPFVIMPEGNHGNKRRLRPLVKGIFRIAFRAQEKYGESEGVQIVPVGIDYGKYENFGSTVLAVYGEPVSVGEYFGNYQEDNARGINKLRERLAAEMPKYMIDIRTELYYNTWLSLRTIFNREMRKLAGIGGRDLYSRFRADKQMIAMLDEALEKEPERIEKIHMLVSGYMKGIGKLKIRDWVVGRGGLRMPVLLLLSLGMIPGLPVFLTGLITNIIPYRLPLLFIKKIRDRQFHSSVKFVAGLVLFPVYYLLLFLAAVFLTRGVWWIEWVVLAGLPLSGLLAHRYFIGLKKMRALWKYALNRKNRRSELPGLIDKREEIIAEMTDLARNYY